MGGDDDDDELGVMATVIVVKRYDEVDKKADDILPAFLLRSLLQAKLPTQHAPPLPWQSGPLAPP